MESYLRSWFSISIPSTTWVSWLKIRTKTWHLWTWMSSNALLLFFSCLYNSKLPVGVMLVLSVPLLRCTCTSCFAVWHISIPRVFVTETSSLRTFWWTQRQPSSNSVTLAGKYCALPLDVSYHSFHHCDCLLLSTHVELALPAVLSFSVSDVDLSYISVAMFWVHESNHSEKWRFNIEWHYIS